MNAAYGNIQSHAKEKTCQKMNDNKSVVVNETPYFFPCSGIAHLQPNAIVATKTRSVSDRFQPNPT